MSPHDMLVDRGADLHIGRPDLAGRDLDGRHGLPVGGAETLRDDSRAWGLSTEGEDAVARNREIMGATDPSKAAPGTLRALYANNMTENAVHGSDSPESAAREIAFFFSEKEIS